MTPDSHSSPRRPIGRPALLALGSLLLLLAFVPPETRGEGMAGASLLVLFLAVWQRRGLIRHCPWAVWVALGTVFLSTLLAAGGATPAAAVFPTAVLLVAVTLAATTRALRVRGGAALVVGASAVLAGAGGAIGLYALYQKWFGLERLAQTLADGLVVPDQAQVAARLAAGRAFANFPTPAALGGFLALALPPTLALVFATRGPKRVWPIAAALLQLAGVAASASASALVALLVGLGCFGVARFGKAVAIWVALGTVVLAGSAVLTRGTQLLTWDDPNSAWRLRAGNVRAAIEMTGDHPWFGVGPGAFSEVYPSYRRPGDNETRHVHNLPFEMTSELGWLAGGLATIGFFVACLSRFSWARRAGPLGDEGAFELAAASALAGFAVHNLLDFTAYLPSIAWSAAILWGLVAVPARERRAAPSLDVPGLLYGAAVVVALVVTSLHGLSWNERYAARVAHRAGELERAGAHAVRARALAPWSADAAVLEASLVAELARSADQRQRALDGVDRALRIAPRRPGLHALRGELRIGQGDLRGAYADYVRAARLYPLHASYRERRAELREALGSPARPEMP